MDIIYIILGIGLLYLGGEWLLSGALSASVKMGIPKVLASVLLIGFGTSAPELFVSFKAVMRDSSDIAVGNVMGSNMANILLIAGLGMLLSPVVHRIQNIGAESTFLLVSACMPLGAMVLWGGMKLPLAILSLVLLMIYFAIALNRPYDSQKDTEFQDMPIYKIIVCIGAGLAMLVVGSDVLISGAVSIATKLGVSEAIIGVSMVAVGTSLPEIATTVSAARRNQGEMIIGNVLGSNLFNTLLVLGGIGIYQFIPITAEDFTTEVITIPLISAVLIWAIYHQKCTKITGICALGAYVMYIASWGV